MAPVSTPLPRNDRKAIIGGGRMLDTLLIACGADIGGHRHASRISRAIDELSQNSGAAACVACHRGLCTTRPAAAILVAYALPKPRAITTTPVCLPCFAKPLAELSDHFERALGRIVIGGRWLDPLPADTS